MKPKHRKHRDINPGNPPGVYQLLAIGTRVQLVEKDQIKFGIIDHVNISTNIYKIKLDTGGVRNLPAGRFKMALEKVK